MPREHVSIRDLQDHALKHNGTGGRLQPVLMRHTPQLSVKTRRGGGGGGGLGVDLGGVGWGV